MAGEIVTFRIDDLTIQGFEALASASRSEGFRFVDRLIAEWSSGDNKFTGAGEIMLGALHSHDLVAIGGLNRDPYSTDVRVARIRHVYVAPEKRGLGLGKLVVQQLLDAAAQNFDCVRLRTDTAVASAFYDALGFARSSDPVATHVLRLEKLDPSQRVGWVEREPSPNNKLESIPGLDAEQGD